MHVSSPPGPFADFTAGTGLHGRPGGVGDVPLARELLGYCNIRTEREKARSVGEMGYAFVCCSHCVMPSTPVIEVSHRR